MSAESEIKREFVNDGREDVNIRVNGHHLVTIVEEGYKSMGLTYRQAQSFGLSIVELLKATAELLGANK